MATEAEIIEELEETHDELDRAYAMIEEYSREAVVLQLRLKAMQNKAWWRSYNAALTGLHAYSRQGYEQLTAQLIHKYATESADLAHGKLES